MSAIKFGKVISLLSALGLLGQQFAIAEPAVEAYSAPRRFSRQAPTEAAQVAPSTPSAVAAQTTTTMSVGDLPSALLVRPRETLIIDLSSGASSGSVNIRNLGTILVRTPSGADGPSALQVSETSALLSLLNVGTLVNARSGTIANPTGDLLINATYIANAGTITAKNLLGINVSGILQNSGIIKSDSGNVDVSSFGGGALAFNNVGGLISAQDGAVNIISPHGNIGLAGGAIEAPITNFKAPGGAITAKLDSISGLVNTYSEAANVGVANGNLALGALTATGDPTYFNDSGNITINGNISVGEQLAILASGNITVAPGVSLIQARSAAGKGFDIIIVAGAALVGSGATSIINTTPPIAGQATTAVTMTGLPSATGGDIDLTGSSSLQINANSTCAGCSGANITMAAFANGPTGGRILLAAPTATTDGTVVSAGGKGAGSNGNITLVAGTSSGVAITTGTLTTFTGAGTKLNTGEIKLSTAQPTTSDAQPIVFSTTGAITSGNSISASPAIEPSSIHVTGDLSARNGITAVAGANIAAKSNIIDVIPTGTGAAFPAASPDGKRIYVPSPSTGELLVINATTNSVIASINTGGLLPSNVVVSPNGTRAYVSNSGSDTISVVNTSTHKVIATISGIAGVAGLAIDSTGKRLFATANSSDSLAVIDTTTNTVISTVPVGAAPNAISYNNSNSKVYVANTASNTISVYNPAEETVANSPLTFSPAGFGRCPCGTKIFVSEDGGNSLHIFSTELDAIIGSPITVGSNPQAIGINPTGSTGYVADSGSGTLSVLTTLTNTIPQTIPLGGGAVPTGVAASFVGNNPMAYVVDSTGSIYVVKTPALSSPRMNISSTAGNIDIATGSTTVAASSGGGSVVVTSPSALVSAGGSATGGYQLATTNKITVTAPVTAEFIDFHAIAGSLTNNSVMTAQTLFFIATPTITNNGTLSAFNAAGDANLALQSPSGLLSVKLGPSSTLSVSSPGNSGTLDFNAAGGAKISVLGTGVISVPDSTDNINIFGNNGVVIDMRIPRITGTINVVRRARSVNIQTTLGDLTLCGCIDVSSSTGNGGTISLNAAGGSIGIAGDLITNGTGAGNRAGNVTLNALNDIEIIAGGVNADGLGGAAAGNITLTTRFGDIEMLSVGAPSLSATGGGTAGGNVKVTATGNVLSTGDISARTVLLKSTSPCCTQITADGDITSTAGAITFQAPGGLEVNGAVQSATSLSLRATKGNIGIHGDLSTARGSILVISGGSNITIDNATITASSPVAGVPAKVTIQNTSTVSGSINIGANTSINTSGAGGGNIAVAVGGTGTRVGPVPAGVVYSPAPGPTGPFFFGKNGINLVNPGNVSLSSVNGAKVIFNTGTRPSSSITLDASLGPITFSAVGERTVDNLIDEFVVDCDVDDI